MSKNVKMIFTGGKGAPGRVMLNNKLTKLEVGSVYTLPEYLLVNPWFVAKNPKNLKKFKKAPLPTKKDSALKDVSPQDEADDAFTAHLKQSVPGEHQSLN